MKKTNSQSEPTISLPDRWSWRSMEEYINDPKWVEVTADEVRNSRMTFPRGVVFVLKDKQLPEALMTGHGQEIRIEIHHDLMTKPSSAQYGTMGTMHAWAEVISRSRFEEPQHEPLITGARWDFPKNVRWSFELPHPQTGEALIQAILDNSNWVFGEAERLLREGKV